MVVYLHPTSAVSADDLRPAVGVDISHHDSHFFLAPFMRIDKIIIIAAGLITGDAFTGDVIAIDLRVGFWHQRLLQLAGLFISLPRIPRALWARQQGRAQARRSTGMVVATVGLPVVSNSRPTSVRSWRSMIS